LAAHVEAFETNVFQIAQGERQRELARALNILSPWLSRSRNSFARERRQRRGTAWLIAAMLES